MKLSVDPTIFEQFPDLILGVVAVKNIDNLGADDEVLRLLQEQQQEVKKKYSKDTLSENPKIAAWRQAYSAFGAKPKKYKCSVENLYRMILDDIELKHINKLVDLYNYISLKYTIPAGGDDLDKVEGDIKLTFASGKETFQALNTEEIKNPPSGEVVYKDDKEILCRRWNWRECDKSKMTEATRNVSLVVEGLPPFTKDDIYKITQELASLVAKFCGGEVKIDILDKEKKEVNLLS